MTQKKRKVSRFLAAFLALILLIGSGASSPLKTRADEISSDPSVSVLPEKTLTYAVPDETDENGEVTKVSDLSVKFTSEGEGFQNDYGAYISELDEEDQKDALKTLEESENKQFDVASGYEISLRDASQSNVEPEDPVTVDIDLPDTEILKDTELFHIQSDDTVESVPYEIKGEGEVEFTTDSFSPFLFVKEKEEQNEETLDLKAGEKENQILTAVNPKKQMAKATAVQKIDIRDFSTQLFYGAKKNSDGVYVWTVPTATNENAEGHNFAYRINFSVSGVDKVPVGSILITIPQHTLINRYNEDSDNVEWSIPSREEVEAATDADGNINPDEIDTDVSYEYYKNGDDYVITNFREVPAGENSYIELSYKTKEDSFAYKDMQKMDPFTASMTVMNDTGNVTKTADPIYTAIDTTAEIASTEKKYPNVRYKKWNSSWGDAVKPADPSKYYYIIWNINSNVRATQPYIFTITEDLKSNCGDKMTILGYRFDGQETFGKDNFVENQTFQNRWDYVLMAIPLDTYGNETYWEADNKETAQVTPLDKVDEATSATSSQTWTWKKPTFHAPTGSFNTYKRADGAYRTYVADRNLPYRYIYSNTEEPYNDRDFKGAKYSRYDLESFNGYNDQEKTLSTYGGLDYASWIVGYPYPWTLKDGADASDPASYGKKNVKYVLVDDGVFLINNTKAITSSDGSTKRTIENGGIAETVDGEKAAVKLTSDDFRIQKIEYSWSMSDSQYDEDTARFTSAEATYTDDDKLMFYGKINGSDDWVKIGEYDIKDKKAIPVNDYVSAMDDKTITFKDDVTCTAYKVETENAHYHSQIFTAPFYELKDSDTVSSLLKDKTDGALLNNDEGTVYEYDEKSNRYNADPIVTMDASDTDFFCVSQRDSSLKKQVASTSNNTRKKLFTVTWKIEEKETMISGEDGKKSYIPQSSGIFYDLLPKGSSLSPDTIFVTDGDKALSDSDWTYKMIPNYEETGRTMLVISIPKEGDQYNVMFDTTYSWNDLKDYSRYVYNPVAYETGNETMTKGFPNNGGFKTASGKDNPDVIQDAKYFPEVDVKTGMSKEAATGSKFLYAENSDNLLLLMAASSGLTKKVKTEGDSKYTTDTNVNVNGDYSYELRYMTNPSSRAKDLIFFDSLENYNPDNKKDDGTASDWRGTLSSIDLNQIKDQGVNPVVYISTVKDLDPDAHHDLSDADIWTKVDAATDLSKAKAVAVDMRKTTSGEDFTLDADRSLVAHLYMKAPKDAPKARSGEGYPYTYNNVYMANTILGKETGSESFFIHQDYTKTSLTVVGSMKLHKIDSKTKTEISGVLFAVTGTSFYNMKVNQNYTTDGYGNISIEKLPMGTYTLREYYAGPDHLLDPTPHTLKVNEDGSVTFDGKPTSGNPPEIENDPRVHTNISFMKVDALYQSKKLKGAVYRLYGRSDYGNDVSLTRTSNGDGRLYFRDVEKGTYKLQEITPPEGYILDKQTYEVTVTEEASVTKKVAQS